MRLADWPERLASVIEEWERKAFAWGTADCVCFANDVHVALTGEDKMAPWRGKYDSKNEAKRLMWGDLADMVSAVLPSLPVHLAKRGDIVMVRKGLGVCLGAQAAVRAQGSGLLMVPMRDVMRAWATGVGREVYGF